MPKNLVEAARGEGRTDWLHELPGLVRELQVRWSLVLGAPFEPGGTTAWVAPARDPSGADLVMKVAWRHMESEQEAAGLHEWNGDGAVRLIASEQFDASTALLLERCRPGTALSTQPEPEQDEVIALILRHLWREPAPGHPFRPLQQMCDYWADETERKAERGSSELDVGLVREGLAIFRELPTTAERSVLLCTDAHAGNVLAAERSPWLLIDPKPFVGDPTYDALQHLLNCEQRLYADPSGLTRRMAELLELDSKRLLLWLFARCVQESCNWPGLGNIARAIAP